MHLYFISRLCPSTIVLCVEMMQGCTDGGLHLDLSLVSCHSSSSHIALGSFIFFNLPCEGQSEDSFLRYKGQTELGATRSIRIPQ